MPRDTSARDDDGQAKKAVTDALDELLSRREVLRKGAAASTAVGVGLTATAGNAAASGASEEETETESGDGEDVSAVDVLNYALTLEKLEATFYNRGLEDFGEDDFSDAEFAQNLGEDNRGELYERFETIRDHEQAHVDTIASTIQDLDGEPISGLEFEFGYESADEFASLAMTLENTGVYAYDGAINLLEDDALLTAAATIATVEGRHASYLNLINDTSPFPNAFDKALPMEEVREAVSEFIVES